MKMHLQSAGSPAALTALYASPFGGCACRGICGFMKVHSHIIGELTAQCVIQPIAQAPSCMTAVAAIMSTTAMVHKQGSYKGKSPIIGFFWAAAADCDFVMVTRAGLEIYTLTGDRQASIKLHNLEPCM